MGKDHSLRDTAIASDQHPDAGVIRLVSLCRTSRHVTVEFRVTAKQRPRTVISKTSGMRMLVTEAVIADSSARMSLVLWNEDADEVESGQVYRLTNGYVSVLHECMRLRRGREGEFVKLHDQNIDVAESPDMSAPLFGVRRKSGGSETGKTFEGVAGRETKGYCSSKGF